MNRKKLFAVFHHKKRSFLILCRLWIRTTCNNLQHYKNG